MSLTFLCCTHESLAVSQLHEMLDMQSMQFVRLEQLSRGIDLTLSAERMINLDGETYKYIVATNTIGRLLKRLLKHGLKSKMQ